MITKLKTLFSAATMVVGLAAIPAVAQDLDLSLDTIYFDADALPQMGSAVSEFVYAAETMDKFCSANDVVNDKGDSLCSLYSQALQQTISSEEDMRFDVRYLSELPSHLTGYTADRAASLIFDIHDIFNSFSNGEIICPHVDSDDCKVIYNIENQGVGLRVVFPFLPPA